MFASLPPQSRILVTGANGFVASHIVNLLLQRGYRVRGTVREPRPWLDQLFQKYDYESALLPDLAQPHASLFEDVEGVVLVATDNSFDRDPALIERVVQGTLAMLEAAKHSAVKSVVLTSSSAACNTLTYASEPTVIDNGWPISIYMGVVWCTNRRSHVQRLSRRSCSSWGESARGRPRSDRLRRLQD